ncbi:OsmC family protein [Pelobacter seleniigenes]|uniref:OsmC family protein n=1 Tax=Pelobacter seleniigenes TaxID=407188 RepID=UPI0004A76729|nr:OsmC family protein [Pelobacter seleniigenes]
MIQAESQNQDFLTFFTNGEQEGIADTTSDKGGSNQGFRPHDLLEAALASCMNITLRMTAQQMGIALSQVRVSVSLDRSSPDRSTFGYSVVFPDSLSEPEQQTLLAAIENCPVRNTLSKGLWFTPIDD